ncbi:hypothetical protein M1105_09065 [Limibaculum sp. FT325]|uniref:hypothetical protein n=1 Tax=Thermohalobaculum sediminis TaxID=2939436 RepID=UPI0020BE52ED|nr:hypothetical protein [Limibaculum sediminis]MCL5777135.1 hypothetical protein [Limibaculum sediminis]
MQTQRIDGSGWIATLFDPGHANMFIITVPALLMVMLGARKFALLYFFGGAMYLMLKNMS